MDLAGCERLSSSGATGAVTRHTSHVTRHTSHVTRHKSHVTSHITCKVTASTVSSDNDAITAGDPNRVDVAAAAAAAAAAACMRRNSTSACNFQ